MEGIELAECQDCLQMKPLVSLNPEGYCHVCQAYHANDLIFKVWPKLLKTSTYEGHGLYAVSFVGGGVKVGKSHRIKERLKAYEHPWCRPIHRILTIQCPPEQLSVMEKRLLQLMKQPSSSEYFPDMEYSEAEAWLKLLVSKFLPVFQESVAYKSA